MFTKKEIWRVAYRQIWRGKYPSNNTQAIIPTGSQTEGRRRQAAAACLYLLAGSPSSRYHSI